jgi:hypothetical protein
MKVVSANPDEIHDSGELMLSCEVLSSGSPSRGDKIAHASNRQNDEDMVTFAGYTSLCHSSYLSQVIFAFSPHLFAFSDIDSRPLFGATDGGPARHGRL